MAGREFDIVVFGATGDTGVTACCCLYFRGKSLGIKSWAPAARNLGRLEESLSKLKDQSVGEDGVLPGSPVQADSSDYVSMVNMCKRAKCVVACAGPFADYGEPVVKACIEAGTHYVDVTGEVPWVQKMEKKYGEEAKKKGVSIISMAGYDSVPPDLSTYLAAKALEKEGEKIDRFDLFAGGGGGAMPTGTINTLVQGVDMAKAGFWSTITFGMIGGSTEPAKPKEPKEPKESKASSSGSKVTYVPQSEEQVKSNNLFWSMCPGYSSLAGQFCVPHFMAPININVVHRTACQEGYGGLTYRERMAGLPSGILSLYGLLPTLAGVASAFALAAFLPLPGSTSAIIAFRDRYNPAKTANARKAMVAQFSSTGKTTAYGYGVSKNGVRVTTELKCKYDPGLGFTMLSACTVAGLIVQKPDEKVRPGFQTAVTGVGGEELAEAFRKAGVEVKVAVAPQSKL